MKRISILLGIFIGCLLIPLTAFAQEAQPCSTGANAAAPVDGSGGGGIPPFNGHPLCSASAGEIVCNKNGGYLYTFTVTNNTGSDVTSVLATPPLNGGYAITPQIPLIPGGVIHHGSSATLQVTITGGQPGQKICFPVTLMTGGRCCTIEVCVTLPNCCAAFNQIKLECNKDGSYSFTFTITNKTANDVQHIYFHAPAGTTITPSYFPVNLNPNATSQPLTVLITGAKPGRFCFGVSLHTEGMKTCCIFEQCIDLPECVPPFECANGICCSRAPMYDGTRFIGQKVAVVTGKLVPPNSPDYVVTAFDVSGANGWGVNSATPPPGNQPPKYNGPAGAPWDSAHLGSVFGVDMDHLGNIYVSASVAFISDAVASGGWGAVYKIDTGSGAISTFAQLPNTPDSSGQYPALGDIAFNCRRKEFYVTDMDDGRIYRIDMNRNKLSAYDHTTNTVTNNTNAEPNDPQGVAPLGERLWAVQVHDNRVYYSLWNEDCGHKDPNRNNEIWSVGLDPITGDFVPGTRKLEIKVPDLPTGNFSNPVSDIAFHRDGRMLIAERSMQDVSNVQYHSSRVLEYTCTKDGWVLTPPNSGLPYKYNIGEGFSACGIPTAAQPSNAAGGIDFDFDVNATYSVYATGDALQYNSSPQIYGFQLFKLTGGSKITSPLLAVYGHGNFKTEIGDIEVSCPPIDNLY
ncbi:MAG: hypothetical protein ABI779_07920 [Acidobacteriota bacterium]